MLCGGGIFAALQHYSSINEDDVTATWDFTSNADPRAVGLFNSGGLGTLNSNVQGIALSIDATASGAKFDSQNRTGDAQVNNGTIIKVPVKNAGDEVTIVGNWKVSYTIGSNKEAVTDLQKTYTATAADATAKEVVITSTDNNTYFYSITVKQKAAPAPLYILGADAGWNLPDNLTEMTWNSASSTYEYTFTNTAEKAHFCLADGGTQLSGDNKWGDFHAYRLSIGKGDNAITLDTPTQLQKFDEDGTIVIEGAGVYKISVTSELKITVTKTGDVESQPTTEAAYYVVGNMTNWVENGLKEEYKMTLNTAAEGTEYMLPDVSLKTTDMFKVVKSDGSSITYYPSGQGNAYGENGEITADGEYTIYFRPNEDGDDDWFYKCIYATKNEPVSTWRDIKINLMEHSELLTESNVYITVAEDGSIGTTDDATKAAATIKGKVHNSYGSSNFTAAVPVEGCVKITYATHDFGNDITVTNDAGTEVAKFNTNGAKWMSNHDNVVVAYYRTNEPTTLHFSNANYNPYFAVEAIDEKDLPAEVTTYNVTFAKGEGVEGVVPAKLEVNAGGKFTAPKNTSLYKEGYTLNGWESGDAIYLPGQEITPEANMTLTARFIQNEVSLADRTEAVTISYALDGSVAQYNYEGKTGIMVTQATVNGKIIDVKVDVNATGGKFAYNGSGWHQVNKGTKVTVPLCKGATISVTAYTTASSIKINGEAGEQSKQVATYTATANDATVEIEQINNDYWNALTITLPVVKLDYYVVGSMTDWKVDEAYKMTLNTQATGEEYMITKSLKAGDQFKVVKSDGKTINDNDWYPAGGEDHNYKVTADGTYDIYFRPDKQGGADWHEGYIYAAAEEEPAEITGTIFSADVIATAKVSFAANTANQEITAEQANIEGGKLYATNGEANAKDLIGKQGNKFMFCLTNNTTFFKIELDNALAEGDIIAAKTYSRTDSGLGLWISTATSRPNSCTSALSIDAVESPAYEDFSSYTVTAEDGLVGAKTIYIYRAVGKSTYFDEFTITRPAEEEPVAQDITATWDFANNCANLPSKKDGGTYTATTMVSNVETISMDIIYDGGAYGGSIKNNDNSYQVGYYVTMRIPVKNVGDEVIVKGYPNYAQYTVGNIDVNSSNDNGATPDATYKAKASDVENGYVAITSKSNNNYIISITVNQYAPKEATTLDNEPATATFPFNLGTEGQKATFTKADYWLNSKVVLGSNNSYKGTVTVNGVTLTLIEPTDKLDKAGETGTIRFLIQPKFGFTFTPTKVALKASKVGTDNGTIDVAWQNTDGTAVNLATNIAPERNNKNGYSSLEYTNLSGATPGEGACGVVVSLYGLQNGKQMAFSDIIIEGTLSGTEKDVPVLASFNINNTEYQVEDIFGDEYEATLKLSKKEAMVSSTNAVTATATNGEIGTITYENATETGCKVTIPVTAGETTLNYVLNVTQKPDYTLTYYAVDGKTVLGTDTREEDQTIAEFKVNIADVASSKDGFKARGWFKQNYVGAKYKTTDVVTSNLKLYAVETEIEVPSDSKKYFFDLTDVNFDANDHEAFTPTAGGWHDKQHGWMFGNGDQIKLLVGAKADIIFTLCQYSKEGSTIALGETSISAVGGSDGATGTIKYEGEPGEVTLTVNSTGSVYIHSIKIVNTTTTNYTQEGNWIKVKAGDASSLLDALDAAAGITGNERVYIYLPNGTYDLAQTTLTTIGRDNVSLIGESMEGVIIKNRPVKEGIAITATLLNTSKGLYMQDLTLDCVAPYGTGDDTKSAERGVCFQDKGTETVLKNVYLKGLQDTYYNNSAEGMVGYFETSKIEGTVDFICGSGSVMFNGCDLYVANRSEASGNVTAANVITAPRTYASEKGYLFYGCTVDGTTNQNGKFNLGRPWQEYPAATFINTELKINSSTAGWTSMNSVKGIRFHEYKTTYNNAEITTHNVDACATTGTKDALYLTEETAAPYEYAAFFGAWDPAKLAEQFVFANAAIIKDGTISWTAIDGAVAYAIYEGDELLTIVDGDQTSFVLPLSAPAMAPSLEASTPVYKIRIANRCGGLGIPQTVTIADGITKLNAEDLNGETVIYDLNGRRVMNPGKGVYIINGKKTILK